MMGFNLYCSAGARRPGAAAGPVKFSRGVFKGVLSACLVLLAAGTCFSGNTPVDLDVEKLMHSPDEHGNVLPDFSHVGYMGGGVALPDVPAVKELSPAAGGDDRERIQEALDEIGKMARDEDGFRGALLLRAGEYRVGGPLRIEKSGVVLRGEGQFPGGTSIIAARSGQPVTRDRMEHSVIFIGEPERTRPRLGFLEEDFATAIAASVPVGGKIIKVRNADGFDAGDNIVIEVSPNVRWLEKLGLEDSWRAGIYHRYERKITGVEGGNIVIDSPMVHFLEPGLFSRLRVWKYSEDPRISQSGVESIRLVSEYNTDDPADGTTWVNGIYINNARDCWVRNITAMHFQFNAVGIYCNARNITVQDCASIRPMTYRNWGGRYPFYIRGSLSLVQRCYTRNARHGFVSSPRVPGPNVFLDGLAENEYQDIGPHQQWDTGFLYDNITAPGGQIYVQNRGARHGWRGANQVFWNCKTASMICDQPRTPDTNWSIGNIAFRIAGRQAEMPGVWISHNRSVSPRSLYLWQLENRLGEEAVRNIAIDVQRQGDAGMVRDYLKDKFAELSERELDDEGNLFKGGSTFRDIDTGPQKWQFSSAQEGFHRKRIGDLVNEGLVKRVENPVHGDDSALEFPRGVLRYQYDDPVDYPDPSVNEYKYLLAFDYRAPEGASITPRLTYNYIEHNREDNTSERKRGKFTEGTVAEGSGQWQNYSFRFALAPEFDEAGMPYRMLLRIQMVSDEEFAFANPRLEIYEKNRD